MKNQFIVKHFMKNKHVKAYVIYPDGRAKLYYAIPDNDTIKVDNKIYNLTVEEKYLTGKNIPTYFYDSNNIEPKNLFKEDCINKVLTAKQLNTAISSKVATEIFQASSGSMDKVTISMILSGVVIAVVLVGLYMLNGKLDGIIETLEKIKQVTDLMGGIG